MSNILLWRTIMKKLQLLTLSMLLTGSIALSASQTSQDTPTSQADRKKEITDKINAIKDKQSAADFNDNELENKKIELQETLQDQIKLISTNLPNGTSEEQKTQKANAQDERTYLKIKLEARKSELQARVTFMQSNLKSNTIKLQALKNRNTELQTKITTNKENGKVMSLSRTKNLQEQQKTILNDIAEITAQIKKMQDQLKQYNSSFTELQKTLNDPTNN